MIRIANGQLVKTAIGAANDGRHTPRIGGEDTDFSNHGPGVHGFAEFGNIELPLRQIKDAVGLVAFVYESLSDTKLALLHVG